MRLDGSLAPCTATCVVDTNDQCNGGGTIQTVSCCSGNDGACDTVPLFEFSPTTPSYSQPEEPNGKGRKISYSGKMW
jgi:hypothetical protein